ncbi:hypothetical protein FHS55_004253 [Angulomicrobium tetraedrale]|uniref:Uncharacterized protein n=1 Tax=Ancylobacter tetraedralis TaxID=217068 RepID=A0A839ZFI3_9HYPH|nr:hypothetical protein [Ancylobacter tetraedralis]MBB3773611.1 hypothetical protein [Ancylobacter tetraedralis]
MNKIVREHYPVEKLPEDLREGIEGTHVRVTLVTEVVPGSEADDRIDAILRNPQPMTIEQARASVGRRGTTTDEAVARIRALRDEWGD